MNLVACPRGGTLLLGPFPGVGLAVDGRREAIVAGLAAFRDAGASLLVALVPAEDFGRLGAAGYPAMVEEAGLAWLHLPVMDFAAPGRAFGDGWRAHRAMVHARLDRGETVGVHCRAGLGRTGTVAAMILVERGLAPEEAIAAVRAARSGTIETGEQEAWVRALAPERAR